MNVPRAQNFELLQCGTKFGFHFLRRQRARHARHTEDLEIFEPRELLWCGRLNEPHCPDAGQCELLQRIRRAGEVIAVENKEELAHVRRADFQVRSIAGFPTCELLADPTRRNSPHAADLEIGDTAGWETRATNWHPTRTTLFLQTSSGSSSLGSQVYS